MSVVELKIQIASTGITKVLRFSPETSVAAAVVQIIEKANEAGHTEVQQDHALFRPALEGQLLPPKWLNPEKTLKFYDLQSDTTVEFRKKHRQRKVKLLDDTIKTFLVNETLSVQNCVDFIANKMSIKNAEEFSLQRETGEWLNAVGIIGEQRLGEEDVLVFKKKFFFSDANIDRTDPVQVHMLYIQCRDSVMEGRYPTTKEEARDLAAFQAQITYGDCIPGKQYDLKALIPVHLLKVKGLKKEIAAEYDKLVGTAEFNAKYIQLCRCLKTYGITTFSVKILEPSPKAKDVLLGITRESLIILDLNTKQVLHTYKLSMIKRWAASEKALTLDLGEYGDEYMVFTEGGEVTDLIDGYIDITLKAKADPGKPDSTMMAVEQKVNQPNAKGYTVQTTGMLGRLYNAATGLVGGNTGAAHVPASQKVAITDLNSAVHAVELLISELDAATKAPRRPSGKPVANITAEDMRRILVEKASVVASLSSSVLAEFNGPRTMQTMRQTLVSKGQQLMSSLSVVATNAQNVPYLTEMATSAPEILEVTKKLANSTLNLIKAFLSADDGNDATVAITRAAFDAYASGLQMAAACGIQSPLLLEPAPAPVPEKKGGSKLSVSNAAPPPKEDKGKEAVKDLPSRPSIIKPNPAPLPTSSSSRVQHSHSPRTSRMTSYSPKRARVSGSPRTNSRSNLQISHTPDVASPSASSSSTPVSPTAKTTKVPEKSIPTKEVKEELKRPPRKVEAPLKETPAPKKEEPKKVEPKKEEVKKVEKPKKEEKPKEEKPKKVEKSKDFEIKRIDAHPVQPKKAAETPRKETTPRNSVESATSPRKASVTASTNKTAVPAANKSTVSAPKPVKISR